MELKYYCTRIDVNQNWNIADNLITPLRWLSNGKHYQVFRINDQFSHAIDRCRIDALALSAMSVSISEGPLLQRDR